MMHVYVLGYFILGSHDSNYLVIEKSMDNDLEAALHNLSRKYQLLHIFEKNILDLYQ